MQFQTMLQQEFLGNRFSSSCSLVAGTEGPLPEALFAWGRLIDGKGGGNDEDDGDGGGDEGGGNGIDDEGVMDVMEVNQNNYLKMLKADNRLNLK